MSRSGVVSIALANTLAAEQSGTVGLRVLRLYNDQAPDSPGAAVVVELVENTPAAKAGIRTGDIIIRCNGTAVADKAAGDILKTNLTGAVGGEVKLKLVRPSENRVFDATLTRVPYPIRKNPDNDSFQFEPRADWQPERMNFLWLEPPKFPITETKNWRSLRDLTTRIRPTLIPISSSGGWMESSNSPPRSFNPTCWHITKASAHNVEEIGNSRRISTACP